MIICKITPYRKRREACNVNNPLQVERSDTQLGVVRPR
jgi:hypothetical protein